MSKIVKYRIKNINEAEYLLAEKGADFEIHGDDCEITVGFALRFEPKNEETTLQIISTFIDKRDRSELLKYVSLFSFQVFEFASVFEMGENTHLKVPDGFLLDVINISIGTTRGMLFTKNRGTYLEKIYYPLFNPLDILNGIKERMGLPKVEVVK